MSTRERGSAPLGVVYSMVVLSIVTVYFVAKSAARIEMSASFFATGDLVLALATTTVLLVMYVYSPTVTQRRSRAGSVVLRYVLPFGN
jgi:hypothetical protein